MIEVIAGIQAYIILGTIISVVLAEMRIIELPNWVVTVAAILTFPAILGILFSKFLIKLFKETFNFYVKIL